MRYEGTRDEYDGTEDEYEGSKSRDGDSWLVTYVATRFVWSTGSSKFESWAVGASVEGTDVG